MSVKRNPRLPGLRAAMASVARAAGTSIEFGLTGKDAASGPQTAAELPSIGFWLEFGTVNIPPRPFLRTSLKRNRRKWSNGLARAFGKTQNPMGFRMAIRRVGVVIVGDTQATIRRGPWAPNAPETVRRKGSSAPLIDTGQLVQSIRAVYKVGGRTVEVIG